LLGLAIDAIVRADADIPEALSPAGLLTPVRQGLGEQGQGGDKDQDGLGLLGFGGPECDEGLAGAAGHDGRRPVGLQEARRDLLDSLLLMGEGVPALDRLDLLVGQPGMDALKVGLRELIELVGTDAADTRPVRDVHREFPGICEDEPVLQRLFGDAQELADVTKGQGDHVGPVLHLIGDVVPGRVHVDPVDPFGVVGQVQGLADVQGDRSDYPDVFGVQDLVQVQVGLHQDLERIAHLDRIGQLARPGLELLEGLDPLEEALLQEPRR